MGRKGSEARVTIERNYNTRGRKKKYLALISRDFRPSFFFLYTTYFLVSILFLISFEFFISNHFHITCHLKIVNKIIGERGRKNYTIYIKNNTTTRISFNSEKLIRHNNNK